MIKQHIKIGHTLPKEGIPGEVFFLLDSNQTAIYDGKQFRIIQTENIKYSVPLNCVNCGAPLTESKCDYCGTKYQIDIL